MLLNGPGTGAYQTLFNGPASSCCTFRLMIDGSLHPFWDAGEYSDQSFTGYTFPLGQWTHVVWTLQAGGAAFHHQTAGAAAEIEDLAGRV